jgi:hypothetical protein
MSERFVRAWKVSPDKLRALIGSRPFAARDVITSKANSPCREDVLMTLGDGDEDEGRSIAEAALTAMLAGRLDASRAYDYGRVTELLLNHAAIPLANKESHQILMQLTYHVPNDTPGRWNPILEACNLPALAKNWAEPNWPFPWNKGASKSDWPTWTIFQSSVLESVHAELTRLSPAQIQAVPDKMFSDEPDYVGDCKKELVDGLKRLRTWVEKARAAENKDGSAWQKRGNALVVLMDGDQ